MLGDASFADLPLVGTPAQDELFLEGKLIAD
jgi:hypothetical protein